MKIAIAVCLALLPSALLAKSPSGNAWYYCASQTEDANNMYYSRAFSYQSNKLDAVQAAWDQYLKDQLKSGGSRLKGGCLSKDIGLSESQIVTEFYRYLTSFKGDTNLKEVKTEWQYH